MRRNTNPLSPVAGFSFIELVFVILLIGIIAAVVIPKMLSQTEIAAILAADLAASDIRAVQHVAIFTGNPRTITFGGNGYTATGLEPEDRTLPGNAVAGPYSITFNSFGEPDQGGNFDITSGSDSKTVTIEALTGKVTTN